MRSFATILTTLSLPLFSLAAYHGSHPRHGAHAGLAARARGDVLHQRDFSARLTYYDITVGLTACGGSYGSGSYVVALNAAQFGDVPGSSQYCGASITITYNGKSVPATVVDKCPGCPYGGLDLTEGVFRALAGGLDAGVIQGSWSFGSGSAPAPAPKKEEPTTTTPKYTPPKTTSTPHYDPPTTTSHYNPPPSSSHHQNTPSPTPETTSSTPSPPPPSSSSSTSTPKTSSAPSTTSTTSSSTTYTSHSYSSSVPADTPTSSVPYASSGLADPAGTIDDNGETEVIADLYQAIIGLANVIDAAQT